ncbi:hypothetical protein HBI38_157630 [Parastagonospora nodorum]|nr:hypothetical protein HBH59_056720 [Parastagonospora nodorum]KAH4982223.1 hypothetical protein HBI76_156990 [Parastagonospora nodorum]KAH5250034.1 hypothetical protein HBI72_155830 [Parastagonospora nodorum]KAH5503073.1 hypothetical protein HBI29_143550 [Parastagonospora nodorum]KAH5507261.1 hypothetical protein HBI52_146820 [Parastagonospora nodorum]
MEPPTTKLRTGAFFHHKRIETKSHDAAQGKILPHINRAQKINAPPSRFPSAPSAPPHADHRVCTISSHFNVQPSPRSHIHRRSKTQTQPHIHSMNSNSIPRPPIPA